MFGPPPDRRPSSVKKPMSGWSHFYPNAGATGNRTPAKDVRTTNPTPTSSVRKKTADELFRENREKALAWAAQRQAQEAPPVSVPVSVAAPNVTVYSPRPTPTFNTETTVPPTVTSPIIQSTSFMQPNVPANQMSARSWTTRLDEPVSSRHNASPPASSPPSNIPKSSPKESVFARFKKEADATPNGSGLLSPFSSKYDTGRAAAVLPQQDTVANENTDVVPENRSHTVNTNIATKKTLKERLLDVTGVTSLRHFERSLLLALLVLSPGVVYFTEQAFLTHVVPASASTVASFITLYDRVYAEFRSMSLREFALAVVLAMVLSVVFDRNTRATDARIHHGWTSLTTYLSYLYTTAANTVGGVCDTAHERGSMHPTSPGIKSSNHDGSIVTNSTAWSSLKSLLSVFARIPLFVRFAVTILIFGGVFRVVMGKMVEVVGVTVVQYAPALGILAALLVCAVVGFVSARYTLRQRAAHRRVVKTIAAVVKALLQQRGRAYPIRYLYEEVAEVVALRHPHSTGGHFLPVFSPVKMTKPAAMFDQHGAAQEPMLVGSPLGLSTSSKEHLLQASMKEATSSEDLTQNTSSTGAVDTTNTASKDVLEGYRLAKVWPAVQQVVESDPRIQRLDLIMDGKKQACWRLLTGSTQAKI